MKNSHCLLIAIFSGVVLSFVLATIPNPQYTVSVHFVPPFSRESCSLGRLWTPKNMTCAMCFCMLPSFSRCVPAPGCNPTNNATSTVKPMPDGGTMPIPDGGQEPPAIITQSPAGEIQASTEVPPPPQPVAPAENVTPVVVPPASEEGRIRRRRR